MRVVGTERPQREHGISIVEVIIAVLVLMAVASAIALAAVGNTKTRGANRLQASLTSAGTAIQEDVASDRGWMSGCTKANQKCPLTVKDDLKSLKDVEGAAVVTLAEATALDSEVDGLAPNDRDGIVPDFYRIVIELEASGEVAGRYSVPAERTKRRFVTTIDRRGVEQVGSVAVEVCRVVNQADERMQIQGCAQAGRTDLKMSPCTPGSRPGCSTAFGWVASKLGSDQGPSPFVSLHRVPPSTFKFSLVSASTGKKWDSTNPDHAKVTEGMVVFQNVPAGEFRIEGLPASLSGGYVRWRSKELPTFHSPEPLSGAVAKSTIAVEPGIRARALVMYRPGDTPKGVGLYFKRNVRTYHVSGPHASTQTAVAPYAPTQGYQGSSAAEMCADQDATGLSDVLSSGAGIYCKEVIHESPNCARVTIYGAYYRKEAGGNYYWDPAEDATPAPVSQLPAGTIGNYGLAFVSGATAARFCTYYAEYYDHKYYSVKAPPTWATLNGAAASAVYYMEPKPDVRHVDYGPGGPFLATPQCVVQERKQCSPSAGPTQPSLATTLKPGLNGGVQVPVTPVDYSAEAATNEHFQARPPWLKSPIFVKRDGSLTDVAGTTHPAGQTHTLIGMGECYWTSVRFTGKVEGPCNPCQPMWTKTLHVSKNRCSILVSTKWRRLAWERSQYYDWQGGGALKHQSMDPIAGKTGSFSYGPDGWECKTAIPKTGKGGTCRAWNTPVTGDYEVPTTKHHSPKTNAKGIVNSVDFGMTMS